MMLAVSAAAYSIHAPAHHRSHARAPLIRAFAEDEPAIAPATAYDHIQPLTTVSELDSAVAAAQAAGRLCVVKVYAPWCSSCRAIQPRFLRAAKSNPGIDFYDIDFSRNKPLCKHCGIEKLPTGMIFKDGEKVEHSSLRPSDFKKFMGKLMGHAEGSPALELYKSKMDELRTHVTELSEDPTSRVV
eukprot:CAMPEP_0119080588 /NCGR_PEP_ID=MMETSP1178-20130426/112710_1 /TAXON_ID=33656 /ORGANISM="unid sp, Strain CCMP2000" /LENGTH=185 /DNA_ID=CAMNT_0007063209 /DNA_START=44 /DNA_END=601 /DNA_ORIENTATION=+